MKTTLEIPDPIFRRAKSAAAQRGVALRVFVTEAVEEKLAAVSARSRPKPKRFKVTPIDLELPEGVNLDKTSAILEALEGPLHR
jgi:hypothetical protein